MSHMQRWVAEACSVGYMCCRKMAKKANFSPRFRAFRHSDALLAPLSILSPTANGMAAPIENKKKGKALVSIEGTPPDLVKPPKGCPFAGRCRYATEQCRNEKPELKEFPGGHQVACHRAEELHSAGGML